MAREIKDCYGYSVQRDASGHWEYVLHFIGSNLTSERSYLTDRRAYDAAQSHRDAINARCNVINGHDEGQSEASRQASLDRYLKA